MNLTNRNVGDTVAIDVNHEFVVTGCLDGEADCDMCDYFFKPIGSECRRCKAGTYLKKVKIPASGEEPSTKVDNPIVHPNHYQMFGVEVDEIIWFILGHEKNKNKTTREIACMYAELKYRLRAGFKGDKLEEDMGKAMNYFKMRK